MAIKLGYRNNLFHPIMLIVCIGLRRLFEYSINREYEMGPFIYPFLIFSSTFLFGVIPYYYFDKKKSKKKKTESNFMGIKLIQKERTIKQADNLNKILFLLFLASYFDFAGTMARKFDFIKCASIKTVENRVRSLQIFISSLLCYFTIRTKIYKHQKFSLYIILFFLVLIILSEFIPNKGISNNDIVESELKYKFLLFAISFFSCFARAYLDTIEKYLFEFNYISPFTILIYEGFIGICILLVTFLVDGCDWKIYRKDKVEFLIFDYECRMNIYVLILLNIFYFILSGFKNIYRVNTTKLYSPMTRALTECILDPIITIFNLFIYNDNKGNREYFWIFFTINVVSLFIITFCSLVYNDFVVLYCYDLEKNTHLEISKRSAINDKSISEQTHSEEEEVDYDN